MAAGLDLWPGQCRLAGRHTVRASSEATLLRPLCEMRCDDRIHQEAMASPQGQGGRASRLPGSRTFVGARSRGRRAHDYRPETAWPVIAQRGPALRQFQWGNGEPAREERENKIRLTRLSTISRGISSASWGISSACPAHAGVAELLVCWLVVVAGGFVDAAAGCSPGHLAGSGLVEVPARLLPPLLHYPRITAPGTPPRRTVRPARRDQHRMALRRNRLAASKINGANFYFCVKGPPRQLDPAAPAADASRARMPLARPRATARRRRPRRRPC